MRVVAFLLEMKNLEGDEPKEEEEEDMDEENKWFNQEEK